MGVWKMKRLREVSTLVLFLGTLCSTRADSITGSSSRSENVDTPPPPGWQVLDNRTDTGFNQTQANEDQPITGNHPNSGVLTSPNYPDNYPDSLNLTQIIQVTEGKKVKIQFTNFTLIRFSKDYVRITDMDGTVLAHHGHFGEHKSKNWHKEIISSSSTVFVVFFTSRWDNAQGWRLEWETVGDDYTGPRSGSLTSPNYPEKYPNNINVTQTQGWKLCIFGQPGCEPKTPKSKKKGKEEKEKEDPI